jgi:hypothetical protein
MIGSAGGRWLLRVIADHDGSQMSESSASAGRISADLSDRTDFVNADRGFVGALEPMVIKAADGRVVWDMDSWGFLDADCPDTANPSLWRQAQLTAKHGLYEVTGLGHQRDHHLPDPAAGPVRLPARPDAAADQPGLRPQ